MKINGKIEHPRWYDIKCKCDHSDMEKCFPLAECIHCKCKQCENSLPTKFFKINEFDNKGKLIGEKTIKEITIVRGDKYQEIIGWTF